MADNVTVPATGTGTATPVIATDDVGGVHFQKVKLDLGGDGASTAVATSVPVSGTAARGSGVAGNPSVVASRASATPPGAVSQDAVVDLWATLHGALVSFSITPTATLSNVAGSASSVTLLAANTARRGATIWNDSTAILYVKFGATASATSCTVKMVPDSYFEIPFGYTAIIDGIWGSATGSARVTELT